MLFKISLRIDDKYVVEAARSVFVFSFLLVLTKKDLKLIMALGLP